jgi:hypothetical protein
MTAKILEISNVWRIIDLELYPVIELRALWPNGIDGKKPPITKHFRANKYQSLEECRTAFQDEALRLNAAGYNIYVVMNPIREDFSGRSATDEDIAYRNLILIDIDKIGNTGQPSTDDEVDAARQLADEIIHNLTLYNSWPAPIRLMSGNGHHIYYPLSNFPNGESETQILREFLKQLAKQFNNNVVHVDTSVYNASRITKVVGTVARKGTETSDRPYRMARIYEC